MEVRTLGSIEVHDPHRLAIGGPQNRRILAALAIHASEVVSVDRLVNMTWSDGQLPENPERNIRTYIHRLRERLGDDLADRIVTSPPGYVLRVGPDELDTSRFELLVGQADRVVVLGDAASAVAYIDEALSLWRGNPYEEFGGEIWVEAAASRLRDLRVKALEVRAVALIKLQRCQEAASAMKALTAEFPYRERPRELLMLALYGEGRQAEALRVFQEFRTLLVDELGIDPTDALVALERRILDHDPALLIRSHDPSLRSYELDCVIGEGMFAMVWRATQPELHREVAIKQIRHGLANDANFIRRFEVEAQLISSLEHPYIVPLYDYWREPDAAFLVMRLLRGGTLEERIATGPLDAVELRRLVDQIGSALRAAHRRGLVHRDVKPANILLDEDANFYLTDFGIAVGVQGEDDAAVAMSTGSPLYAAPEQLRREGLDARADIYAFGVMLYEAGVGEHPFANETTRAALVRRQMNDPLPTPSSIRETVPRWLDDVVARATTKAPDDRYRSIDDLLADALHSGEPEAHETPRHRSISGLVSGAVRNPFKGLNAFQEADVADFFGRGRLVARFLEVLERPGSAGRLVAAVGPSGSGKSSAVRAGLVPALRSGAIDGSGGWFVTAMMPGAHPFDELESALTRIAPAPPGPLSDLMAGHDRGIGRAVKQVLPDESSELVLVIDQFEELFTLVEDDSERMVFLDGLLQAIREPRSRLRIVLTIRADFWDRPLKHSGLAPLLETAAVTVSPLAADELERAIVDPVAAQQMAYEPGLVALISADVVDQPGALPLLQFALTELFDRHVSGLVLASAYNDMGAMTGAIAKRAEDIYNTYTDHQRRAARRVLGRLVTLGEGAEHTRRRVTMAELNPDPDTDTVIGTLGQARLLTFDRDPLTRGPTVEIAHEALLRAWPRLRDWIDDDRDDLRTHRHLTIAATEWDNNGRDDSELYRGGRLEMAETWTASTDSILNPLESQFLAAGTDRRDADALAERRRVRRFRRLKDEAEQARAQGDLERLRATAGSIAVDSPTIAALLAVEAHRLDPSIESLSTIHEVLTAVPGYRGLAAGGPYVAAELLDGGVTLAAVGPTAIDVWDLRSRELLRSIAHTSPTQSVRFDATAEGRIAATSGELDETVLYDLITGETLGSVQHHAVVYDVSISADGSRLAVALSGGAVEIWNVADLSLEATLDTGQAAVAFARWSPTEDRIAVVTQALEVQFWDAVAAQMLWATPISLGQRPGDVTKAGLPNSFLFGSDGRCVVLLSDYHEGRIRVYETAGGTQPVQPTTLLVPGGFKLLDSMFWIDEENLIIGAPTPGNVDSYDLTNQERLADVLASFKMPIEAVVHSPELDQIIGVGLGGLEFWATDKSGPLERVMPLTPKQRTALAEGAVVLPSLAADGSVLLVSVLKNDLDPPPTTSFDLTMDRPAAKIFGAFPAMTIGFGSYTLYGHIGGVQVLDSSNVALGPPVPFPPDINELGVSHDGRYLSMGRLGGHVDLYTGSGEFIDTVSINEPKAVSGANFTDDGEFMLVGTREGRFGLWTTDPLERIEVPDPGDWIRGKLMGDWLFVTRADGSLIRLDPSTFEQVGDPVPNAEGFLMFGRLDEENLRVASGVAQGVKVFDLQSGLQLGRDLPYSAAVARVEFTADGTVLSVPNNDGVSLWNFDTDTWADIACEMAGRNLTADEWDQLGPRTIDRRATCPQYPLT